MGFIKQLGTAGLCPSVISWFKNHRKYIDISTTNQFVKLELCARTN